MRSSVLLIVLGVFLVARTIVKDDNGETLVGRILGLNTGTDTKAKAKDAKAPARGTVAGASATVDDVADALARIIAANQDPGGTARPTPFGGNRP